MLHKVMHCLKGPPASGSGGTGQSSQGNGKNR